MYKKIKRFLTDIFACLRSRLLGWKTIVWNIFLAVTPAIAVTLQKLDAIDWSQYVGAFGAIFIGFLIGAIGIWLRYISVGPIGSKGTEEPSDPDVKAGD